MFDNLPREILSYIIPVASIFLTYYLGSKKSDKETYHNIQSLWYNSFYVPYLLCLYRGHLFDKLNFSDLTPDVRSHLLDLSSKNLQFLGQSSLMLYPKMYNSFLDYLEYDEGNPIFSHAPDIYNHVMNEFTNALLLEATELERYLKMPGLATTYFLLLSNPRKVQL